MRTSLGQEFPDAIRIDLRGIHGMLSGLFDPKFGDDERLIFALPLLNDVADQLHNEVTGGPCGIQQVRYETTEYLNSRGVSIADFYAVLKSIIHIHDYDLTCINNIIEALEYDYIVNVNYYIERNALTFKFICSEPNRDYKGILRGAVMDALQRGEKVPHKYLHLAGF